MLLVRHVRLSDLCHQQESPGDFCPLSWELYLQTSDQGRRTRWCAAQALSSCSSFERGFPFRLGLGGAFLSLNLNRAIINICCLASWGVWVTGGGATVSSFPTFGPREALVLRGPPRKRRFPLSSKVPLPPKAERAERAVMLFIESGHRVSIYGGQEWP